jgi:arabinogalactan endo-1,4-beta-galactosidase
MDDSSNEFWSRRKFLATTGLGALAGASGLANPWAPGTAQAAAKPRKLILGHDLSTLQQEEDTGHTFSDTGVMQPLEKIVKAHGTTHVRLRLWVDPPMPYNDLPHVVSMAKRLKDAGLKFLLDIHYSDFWADAGNQPTPKRWVGQDLPTLAQTVHDYTRSVIETLASAGTPPQMVQIGNEITGGMLWPQGKIYVENDQRWDEFTTLLKAGIAGARAADTGGHPPRLMVHIDRGGDNPGSRYFYDHITDKGVEFDVIGLSYYPWWHGALDALQFNLNDLATAYKKDIIVVETAYPWTTANGDDYGNIIGSDTYLYTKYRATPKGQTGYLHNVVKILRKTPGGHGLGMFYWEPAWIPGVPWEPGSGNAWDNLTLFDFQGRALPSLDAYRTAPKK